MVSADIRGGGSLEIAQLLGIVTNVLAGRCVNLHVRFRAFRVVLGRTWRYLLILRKNHVNFTSVVHNWLFFVRIVDNVVR